MDPVFSNLSLYVQGLLGTLAICAYSAVGSLVIGTALAGFRVSPLPPLQWFGSAWVTVFRNCPLVIVLFFCAFGIPEIGINGSYFWFGITGLVLYTSAFVCEAVRSGINSVDPGQAEAARSVGLTFGQTLSTVVLPQALRSVIPPVGNVIIAMIKNSAIVGAFGVGGELFSLSDRLSASEGLPVVPVLIGIVVGYLILTIPSGIILGILERKVAIVR